MLGLDVKDRKILYYLSQDSRLGNSQLSKKVGLSKNAVNYRIERLKSEGVIKNFSSNINLGALGFDTFSMILKFKEDIYESKDILEYFKNHPFVDSAIILSGNWDIFVEMVCRDFVHMNQLINQIISQFQDRLDEYQAFFGFARPLRVEHMVESLFDGLELEPEPAKKVKTKPYKIDKIDMKILGLMASLADMKYLDMARELGLTLDVVRYRIKRMREAGILLKSFPEVSLPKLGYTEYLHIIKLRNIKQEKLDGLKARMRGDKNTVYAFFDIAGMNIVSICAFSSPEQMDHMIRGLRKDYSDIIGLQEYMLIKEQLIFNLFPKGLNGEKIV